MTFGSYTELKAEVADYLHRTDLTTKIVSFITLAESEINTDMRLRLMETDATLTLLSGTSSVALPTLYSEPILLELVFTTRDNERLTYLTPSQMPVEVGSSGEPIYWTINGANINFPYPADRNYTLRFRYLTDFDLASTSTNVLLAKYPGIYLYGALLQAAPYLVNDERISTWATMYSNLVAKANKNENRTRVLTTMHTDAPGIGRRNNIYQG